METADILCLILAFFVGLAFVLDLLGASWAALRKKPYKSMIGGFVEDLADNPKLWWFPILIALFFVYGIDVIYKM